MKTARIVQVNQSLQEQNLQTPRPKGAQVLIKIQSSGVCHSDIQLWEGVYQGLKAKFLRLLTEE